MQLLYTIKTYKITKFNLILYKFCKSFTIFCKGFCMHMPSLDSFYFLKGIIFRSWWVSLFPVFPVYYTPGKVRLTWNFNTGTEYEPLLFSIDECQRYLCLPKPRAFPMGKESSKAAHADARDVGSGCAWPYQGKFQFDRHQFKQQYRVRSDAGHIPSENNHMSLCDPIDKRFELCTGVTVESTKCN